MSTGSFSNLGAIAAGGKGAGTTSGLLLGLGLATGMEFYAYDGFNLVLPDHRTLPYFIWKRGAHRSRSAGLLPTLERAICHVAARVGGIVIPITAPSF